MRICDRCKKNRSYTVLVDTRDDSEYDVCQDCYEPFKRFMLSEELEETQVRKVGRPRKDGTN
jgi:protein-arginine kinase activator protein McsA